MRNLRFLKILIVIFIYLQTSSHSLFADQFNKLSPVALPPKLCKSVTKGFASEPCDGFLDDLEFYDPKSGRKIETGPVNSNTVKGFEILYATPGTGDASEIAGHLVLRVKLDNNLYESPPNRLNAETKRSYFVVNRDHASYAKDNKSIENPNDLVISFLADTNENKITEPDKTVPVQKDCEKNWFNLVNENPYQEDAFDSIIQSLKGLSGGFSAVMDRNTLDYTIKNYTIEQDRNLLRYKLNLNEKQKKSLIEKLCIAKNNYKPKYFFFSQNCASVLIKVIAMGIHDDEIEKFNPYVSPPNTLIALLIKKGLATQVFPSFYSYRRKGYIAQEIINKEYNILKATFPSEQWPEKKYFFSKNEDDRFINIKELAELSETKPETSQKIYRIASLVQEAEMVFSYKDLFCENYTSSVTAESRKLQRSILQKPDKDISKYKIDIDHMLNNYWMENEKSETSNGYFHTGHYPLSIGTCYYKSGTGSGNSAIILKTALHHQEMGDLSGIAMQRGGYVDFGKASVLFSNNSDSEHLSISDWGLTGLTLRKFKERLKRIPSFFEPSGSPGLGLTLFDLKGNTIEKKITGSLLGGEILASVFSSQNNNDFLFLSAGVDFVYNRRTANNKNCQTSYEGVGLNFPLGIETLTTFDNIRQLKFRNRLEYSFSTSSDISDELNVSSSLEFFLGKIKNKTILLKLQYGLNKEFENDHIAKNYTTSTGSLLFELNCW